MTTRIVNFFKVIRNNWKKTVFGATALTYGTNYGVDYYNTEQFMRECCTKVAKYGDMPLPAHEKPRHVTVILNPVAKRRKAKKLFEKYCEPLLNLAGIAVTVIQTESENHARQLIIDLQSQTDAILVAGGDGTLSDVVTGLMRKYQADLSFVKKCPIGILPLGQNNRIADSLFHDDEDANNVQKMVDATLAVIQNNIKMVDVVEVEPLEKDEENEMKPVYAIGAIEWGAWKDAHARTNKYWYWGPLRRYVTYIFNGHKNDLNWNCNAVLRYSDPCPGCSQCFEKHHAVEKKVMTTRWWQAFIPKTSQKGPENVDYSQIQNENCSKVNEIPISATELHLFTNNLKPKDQSTSSIKVELGPDIITYANFVAEGWRREKGDKTLVNKTIEAKEIELHLEKSDFESKEKSFYIDNEEFDLKPLKIKLLPQAVKMFCLINNDNYN